MAGSEAKELRISVVNINVFSNVLERVVYVTASAERLYRDIGVEELVPWIWSATNHHDISSLCPPKQSHSRGGGTVSEDSL